jgi:hypothetical protein
MATPASRNDLTPACGAQFALIHAVADEPVAAEGRHIHGIVEFGSASDRPHIIIASAQAICPSKPSDCAIAR